MISKQENQLQKKRNIFYDYFTEKQKKVKDLNYFDVVSHSASINSISLGSSFCSAFLVAK